MEKRIFQILDNVRHWDTCPDDYKKDIETFLDAQNQALQIHDVSDSIDEDSTDCGCEPETCKMLKDKCKNLAYR